MERTQEEIQTGIDEIYLKQLFSLCRSKAELKQWIKTFLKIDLPDYTVDPNSNSNPLEFIWDVYEAAMLGDPNRTTFVVAASRNSMKTLSSAILEFILMLHFGRDIVHMSAILDQSLASVRYLSKFLQLPAMQRYSKVDNQRAKELHGMPTAPHKPSDTAKLLVIVATAKSANAQRANALFFDELDLIDPQILSEASFIADPDKTGKPPIFVYLSSRKSASGPIQRKIDESKDSKNSVRLHTWSALDFMKKCPPAIHKPEEPRVPIFLNLETLEIKDTEEMAFVSPGHKEAYEEVNAYAGCVGCTAFVVCQARSPGQNSTSPALRDISFIGATLRNVGDADKINAQLLNLKPESSGTVFAKFNRRQHIKSVNEAWEYAFGVPADRPVFKEELIRELRSVGWRLHCGVDFGWIDIATGVLIAYEKSTEKVIVLHCEYSPGLSNPDWLAYVKERIYEPYGFDLLCPDTADKSSPSVSARMGMPARSSKPARIETGVSWLRTRIWNASKQEAQLIVLDDPSNHYLVKSFESWQYLRLPMGFDYTRFADDEWTHHLDALRYAIDPFIMNHSAVLSANQSEPARRTVISGDTVEKQKYELKKLMSEHWRTEFGVDLEEPTEDGAQVKTGNVIFSF